MSRRQVVKELIASRESGGDYDIMYGGKKTPLTRMTIGEVIAYQEMLAKKGDKSTAAGKYQIILKTMKDLSKKNPKDFGPDKLFDAEAQEWAADTLMDRRGWKDFESGKKSTEDMALELAKEWASLPNPATGASYYEKDGLNKSHHRVEDVFKVLNVIEARPKNGLR
jgi:muramidase (phage lysozyme)